MDMKPLIPERPTAFPVPAQYAGFGEAGVVDKHGKRGPGALQLGEHHDGDFGVYMAHKKAKLHENFAARYSETDPGTARIFSSVSVYVNGYTAPSLEELKAIIGKGGGKVEHYLSATAVTHVIAQNLPDSKVKEIQAKQKLRHQMPVVYPSWIVDSAKAGRLLPVADYLLPQFRSSNAGITSFMGAPLRTGAGISTREAAHQDSADGGQDEGIVVTRRMKAVELCALDASGGSDAGQQNEGAPVKNDSADLPDLQPAAAAAAAAAPLGAPAIDVEFGRYGAQARLGSYAIPQEQQQAEGGASALESDAGAPSWNGQPDGPSRLVRNAGNDPNFMAGYFNSSRLHFIGGWRSHVQHLVAKESGVGAAAHALPEGEQGEGRQPPLRGSHPTSTSTTGNHSMSQEDEAAVAGTRKASGVLRSSSGFRIIVHVDIDCFFAQVALLDKPHLRDQPVAVAHAGGRPSGTSYTVKAFGDGMDTSRVQPQFSGAPAPLQQPGQPGMHGRGTGSGVTHEPGSTRHLATSFGEISSANYPARAFGIHAGMSVGSALQLCPSLLLLPYAFDKIASISEAVYRHFLAVTPHVQAMSCDEAFLDLTGDPSPLETISKLRSDIYRSTGCTVSAGVGPNMLLAKLATGRAKPNGQYAIGHDTASIAAFMSSLKASSLPGVGWSTGQRLSEAGIVTVGDLLKVSESQLRTWFGPKTGTALYKAARGIDDRPVMVRKVRKSVGAEVNWGIRFGELSQCHEFLRQLGSEVSKRMQQAGTEFAAMFPEHASKAVEANGGVAPPLRARQLSLKLMVRRADAPQAVKFLGHGVCDTFNRTIHLPAATADGDVLAQHAIQAYDSLSVDVKDVRGVGIQLSGLVWCDGRRLEDIGGQASAVQGVAAIGTNSMLQYISSKPRARSPSRAFLCASATRVAGQGESTAYVAGTGRDKDTGQGVAEAAVIEILDDDGSDSSQGGQDDGEAGPAASQLSSHSELMGVGDEQQQTEAFMAIHDGNQSKDTDDNDDADVVEVPDANRIQAAVAQHNRQSRSTTAAGTAGIEDVAEGGFSRASAASGTQGSASGLGYSTGVNMKGVAGPIQSKITFGVPVKSSNAGVGLGQVSPAKPQQRKDRIAAAQKLLPKPSTTFMTDYVAAETELGRRKVIPGLHPALSSTEGGRQHSTQLGSARTRHIAPLLAAEEDEEEEDIQVGVDAADDGDAVAIAVQDHDDVDIIASADDLEDQLERGDHAVGASVVHLTQGNTASPGKQQSKLLHAAAAGAPGLPPHIDVAYLNALPLAMQQEVLDGEARRVGRKKEGLKLMVAGVKDGKRGALAAMIRRDGKHAGAGEAADALAAHGHADEEVVEAQQQQDGVYAPSFVFPPSAYRADGSMDSTLLIPLLQAWLMQATGAHPSPQQAALLCSVVLDCVLDRRVEDALTLHAALQAAVEDMQHEQRRTVESPSRLCWLGSCSCEEVSGSVVASWSDAVRAIRDKIQQAVISAYGRPLAGTAFY